MPVTKTAKRAQKSALRKKAVNDKLKSRLEIALRMAKKKPTKTNIKNAQSLADRAAKKGLIHKNKASRIKSSLNR
jgi:small subunit ribosomal protein S20